jgi:rhodanese-related sulfurtransferase
VSRTQTTIYGLLCGWLCVATALAAEHTRDTLETIKQRLAEKKAVLVDVRSLEEWNKGHLAGAVHVPVTDLDRQPNAEALKKLLQAKIPEGRIVYTYCVVGKRALKAAGLIEKAGYDARALKPGYDDLLKAGFPKAGA